MTASPVISAIVFNVGLPPLPSRSGAAVVVRGLRFRSTPLPAIRILPVPDHSGSPVMHIKQETRVEHDRHTSGLFLLHNGLFVMFSNIEHPQRLTLCQFVSL